jgi:hypothetical protein
MKRSLGLVLCAVLSPVSADIYRCPGPVYQDHPCSGQGERVRVERRSLHAAARPGIRESERRWLAERERARRQQVSGEKSRRAAPAGRRADAAARRCWQRRQRLEAVRRHLRWGYRPLEGDRLRHEAQRLEDYLFRFCD